MYATYSEINLHSVTFQVQGIEDFTKVAVIRTSIDMKKSRWHSGKFLPLMGMPSVSESLGESESFGQFWEFYLPFIK